MSKEESRQAITLLGRTVLTGKVLAVTGLHIGTSKEALEIGGVDMPVVRNPVDRAYDVDWNADGDFADTDALRGPERGYRVFRKDEPRPLVSGEWQDFLICFAPDGAVSVPPFKTNRKRFSRQQQAFVSDPRLNHCNGVIDTTKPWFGGNGMDPGKWEDNYGYNRDAVWMTEASEVAHFDRHTGAYRISFAPDSSDDRDAFADAREALASMWPLWRVEISKQGDVRTYQVRRAGDDWFAGRTVFPASPSVWLQTSGADRQTIGKRCKWGWLQHEKTRSGATWDFFHREPDAVPVGTPITDVITPRMLTDKVWWLE